MTDADRPGNVAEMLSVVAAWLDLVDAREAARVGVIVAGGSVQRDLRSLAAWFAANPDADRAATVYVAGMGGGS